MTDQDDPAEPGYLDGNAAAGLLSELFAVDVTAARGRCAHCGDENVVAAGRLYLHGTGMVLRCALCGEVLAQATELEDSVCLDLRGLAWLRVPI
ncbi:hypothetical protein LLS1_37030 [Leifsonia sp. LS1]|uniref:DUF6510 family protein n=1 Tax=Leifsonia sp. LS1 TaxID=2828483 RepID=UPI001CFCC96D|nr:DUF6510 family protein [Leifsonia sp. LS1]GIT82034.1 hypothetical protein LLS1_37030 [Leifsonia sp. LS1]